MAELSYGEEGGGLPKVSGQLALSEWVTLAISLLSAGILAIILRRLFREELRKGAEALAVGIFLLSHAILLAVGCWLLYVPFAYLWLGQPAHPMTYSVIASMTTILYPGAVAHCTFGAGWRTAIQSIFGSLWARVEAVAIGGLIMNWYIFWSLPNPPPCPQKCHLPRRRP